MVEVGAMKEVVEETLVEVLLEGKESQVEGKLNLCFQVNKTLVSHPTDTTFAVKKDQVV